MIKSFACSSNAANIHSKVQIPLSDGEILLKLRCLIFTKEAIAC
jgi:hypothetical protein